MAKRLPPVGIDDMAFYAPKLYLDIRTLAQERNIPAEKLEQGLGLYKMAVPNGPAARRATCTRLPFF